MKNYTSAIYIAFALMVIGCQQSFDVEKEKEAIIKVVNEETDAYLNFDFETLAQKHLQDTLSLRLSAGRNGYVFLEGWSQISEYLKTAIEGEAVPDDLNVSVSKSNFRIKVYPQSAWVLCDEKWIYHYEKDTVEINSIQVRFLEKIDGEWKIAFISFVGTSGYDELDDAEEIVEIDDPN